MNIMYILLQLHKNLHVKIISKCLHKINEKGVDSNRYVMEKKGKYQLVYV